jgi:hypothetical protein
MKPINGALAALGVLSLPACGPNEGPFEEVADEVDHVIEPRVEGDSDQVKDTAEAAEDNAEHSIEPQR